MTMSRDSALDLPPEGLRIKGGQRSRLTKQRIVDSAVKLFYRHGFRDVSVDQICSDCTKPITKGAFYHVFRSKEEVLYDIHLSYITKSRKYLQKLIRSGRNGVDIFNSIFDHTADMIVAKQDYVVVANREYRYLTGELLEKASGERREYRRLVEHVILQGQSEGLIDRALDPKIAALNYLGMINWVYQWYDQSGSYSANQIMQMTKYQMFNGIVRLER